MLSLLLAAWLSAGVDTPETANYISASGGNTSFSVEHRKGQAVEKVCSFDNCRARSARCEDQEYLCAWTGTVELAVPRNVWARLPKTFLERGREEPGWTHGGYHYTTAPPAFGAQIITQGTPLIGTIRFLGKAIDGVLVTVTAADDPNHEPLAWFLYAAHFGVVAFEVANASGRSGESFWLEGEHGILAQ